VDVQPVVIEVQSELPVVQLPQSTSLAAQGVLSNNQDTNTTSEVAKEAGPVSGRLRPRPNKPNGGARKKATTKTMAVKHGVNKISTAKGGGDNRIKLAGKIEEALDSGDLNKSSTASSAAIESHEPASTLVPVLISAPASEPVPTSEPVPISEPVPTLEPAPTLEPVPTSEPVPSPRPVPASRPVPVPTLALTTTPTPMIESVPGVVPELEVAANVTTNNETAVVVRPSDTILTARQSQYQSFTQPLALVKGNIAPGSFPRPPTSIPVKGDLRFDSYVARLSNHFQEEQETYVHLTTKGPENTPSAPKVFLQSASFIPQQSSPSPAANTANMVPPCAKKHAFGAASTITSTSAPHAGRFVLTSSSPFQSSAARPFESQSSETKLFDISASSPTDPFLGAAYTLPKPAYVPERQKDLAAAQAPGAPAVAVAFEEPPDEKEEPRPDGSEYYELKHHILDKASLLYQTMPPHLVQAISTARALPAPEHVTPPITPANQLARAQEQSDVTERVFYHTIILEDVHGEDADEAVRKKEACIAIGLPWPWEYSRFDLERQYQDLKALIDPKQNTHHMAGVAMENADLAYGVLNTYLKAEARMNPEENRGRYAPIGGFQFTNGGDTESTQTSICFI
jgi:hypothetical protein